MHISLHLEYKISDFTLIFRRTRTATEVRTVPQIHCRHSAKGLGSRGPLRPRRLRTTGLPFIGSWLPCRLWGNAMIHDDLLAPGAGGGERTQITDPYAQWHTPYALSRGKGPSAHARLDRTSMGGSTPLTSSCTYTYMSKCARLASRNPRPQTARPPAAFLSRRDSTHCN